MHSLRVVFFAGAHAALRHPRARFCFALWVISRLADVAHSVTYIVCSFVRALQNVTLPHTASQKGVCMQPSAPQRSEGRALPQPAERVGINPRRFLFVLQSFVTRLFVDSLRRFRFAVCRRLHCSALTGCRPWWGASPHTPTVCSCG